MKITICGSMSFAADMVTVATALEEMGHEVLLPYDTNANVNDPTLKTDPEAEAVYVRENDLYQKHFRKVEAGDAILVVNETKKDIVGYIGTASTMEIGIAHSLFKPIYIWQTPDPKVPVAEDLPLIGAIIIERDLTQIGG